MKASFPLFLVVLLGVAEALPNCDFSEPVQRLPIADSVNDKFIYDPEKIASHYDYIIVGGGLTGLTTAARLTDNPNITVLVIESGFWESDRSIDVSDLTHYGCVFGTTMDHKFATKIQTSDDRSQIIHSGRGLGGSTLINGGSWIQIDAWETIFGNKVWNWKNMLPYMMQAENIRAPGPKQVAAGEYFDPSCHGIGGRVQVGSRDTNDTYSSIMKALMNITKKMGVETMNDLSCGDPRGVSMLPNSVISKQERSDAGRSWLTPEIINRTNLNILVGQWAGKVLIKGPKPLLVFGVEFGLHRSRKYSVNATHEVLLAAGSSVSPLIIEYSGIGIEKVLRAAKVKQIIELPVGVNMQDQTTTTIRNAIKDKGKGQGQAAYFATFNQTLGDSASMAHQMLHNDGLLKKWAEEVVSRGGFHNATALLIQMQSLLNG